MLTQKEAWSAVGRLLEEQRFAVLSTQSETGPYCSLVAFWAAKDLSHVLFATARASRKYGNLASRPQVALLFDNRSNQEVDLEQGIAVTATGMGREVAEAAARAAASAALLTKHPRLAEFVSDPGCAIVRVDIDVLYVVTRFQSVVELRPAVA